MGWKRRLGRDTRGVATIELALWLSFIFAALMPCLDAAAYLMMASRLSSAVQQASILAYNARNLDTLNTTQVVGFVVATAALPAAPKVTIDCNGGQPCATLKTARQCVCVGFSGGNPTYSISAACGAPCPSGASSGYYLRITASYAYTPMIVPNKWLGGGTLTKAVTVRLQ